MTITRPGGRGPGERDRVAEGSHACDQPINAFHRTPGAPVWQGCDGEPSLNNPRGDSAHRAMSLWRWMPSRKVLVNCQVIPLPLRV
jgi:hypothetical protein